MKTIISLLFVLILSFTFSVNIFAQPSSIDTSFNPVVSKDVIIGGTFTLQPDGKILVYGDFQIANGLIKNRFVRFNVDGSVDTTFNPVNIDFIVLSVILQPDGKIIISGGSGSLDSNPRIYRLNTDGSRDTSFVSPFPANSFPNSYFLEVRAVQPDGKVLAALNYRSGSAYNSILYRLSTNGAIDNSFTPITLAAGSGGIFGQTAGKVFVLPNGKIFAVTNIFANCPGCTPGNSLLKRYNADGTLDTTFEPPSATVANNNNGSAAINDYDVHSDGSIVIGGRFEAVNGVSRLNIARILPAGNVDLSFNPSSIPEVKRIKVLPNGNILVHISNQIYRLTANGTFDNSFFQPLNLTIINDWTIDANGRIVIFAVFTENGVSISRFARLNQNGAIESSFTANFGIAGKITAIAVQADGKIVFSGIFDRVNGIISRSIARVNADGSTDQAFNSITIFNTPATKILIQPDGKILLSGSSFNSDGALRYGLIRLNPDGSMETNFNPNITSNTYVTVEDFSLQTDGKIIIAGRFNAVGGQMRTAIARINNDGSLDTSFNPIVGIPTSGNGTITSVLVQSDGKIMVGGTFSGVNGFGRTSLVRLNSDGSLDNTFNAGNIAAVQQIEVQADGKYLVLISTIIRLNNDGTVDTSFTAPQVGTIYQFLRLPDGTILIGGPFGVGPYLARLKPNGILDTAFLPNSANEVVRAFAKQPDGRVLVGGDFTSIGGVPRLGIARLIVSPYQIPPTLFDFDGDRRADVSLFRPSNGTWYLLPSQAGGFYGFPFGQAGDLIAPADYDGDGRTDVAVFRPVVPGAGDQSYFYILNSADNSFRAVAFGTQGDVPMAGDWDGDGKADLAVYRATNVAGGQSNFYYRPSAQPNVNFNTIPLGSFGDKPLLGDFDGDGRLDPAVFSSFLAANGTATWRILRSSVNQIVTIGFGLPTDVPVPADYDGDGITNIAVFRPSNGYWYTNQNPATNYGGIQFGANGDLPVPADYDGDGRADTAVFRPSNGGWYLNRTTTGLAGVQFGASGDKPAPNAYIR